ncbi:unnamed protein product [Durusdinium trenchii]|uniref:Uncharacterized protein n=1 Tax=Durusdinium trenchii TaxID=1381693 RepID=A0ABP0HMS2_9DINO
MRPHAVMNERTQKEWERALMRLAEEKTTHSEPSTILNAVKTWDPSRALNALRWLSKAGSLQFNLTNIVLPTPKSNRQRKKQQAIVVEPPMLPFLEQAIAQCWEQSNPKWSALLSSWLIAVGVMRHQHLLRSEPVRLSRSTLHLWCEKGKQSSKRGGFPWTVPAHFANGFGWAAAMLQAKRAVPAGKRESCGIIFSPWCRVGTS